MNPAKIDISAPYYKVSKPRNIACNNIVFNNLINMQCNQHINHYLVE